MFHLFFESDKHVPPISISQTGVYSSPSFGLSSLENSATDTCSKHPRHVFQRAELRELFVAIQGITSRDHYGLNRLFAFIFASFSYVAVRLPKTPSIFYAGHVVLVELIEGVEFYKFKVWIFR